MTTTFELSDTRYTPDDISDITPGKPSCSIYGSTVVIYADLTEAQLTALKLAISNSDGFYTFRGVRVRNSVDVDNVVSSAIKDAIAPGRPRNLQIDAEQALQSKFAYAQATGDTATVSTIKTFYETVVMPIRAEGNAFIAERGW